jgi:hypothetical protein
VQEHHQLFRGAGVGGAQRRGVQLDRPPAATRRHRLVQVAALALQPVADQPGQRADRQRAARRARQRAAVRHPASPERGVGNQADQAEAAADRGVGPL